MRLSSTRLDSRAPRAMGRKRAGPSRPGLTCSSGCGSSAPWQRPSPQKERESSPPPEVSERAQEEVRQLTTQESCRPAHAHGR